MLGGLLILPYRHGYISSDAEAAYMEQLGKFVV